MEKRTPEQQAQALANLAEQAKVHRRCADTLDRLRKAFERGEEPAALLAEYHGLLGKLEELFNGADSPTVAVADEAVVGLMVAG